MGVCHAKSRDSWNRFAQGAPDFRRDLPVDARDRQFFFDLRLGHRMDLPDLSGATRRNDSAEAIRLVAKMGNRVLRLELAMGHDHLCEAGAAGKGRGTQKPAADSAATWKFIRQAAEAFVKCAESWNGFDFFGQ